MKKRNRADSFVIEQMLAHSPNDEVAKAYDREEYLDECRAQYQVWADIVLEGAPLTLKQGSWSSKLGVNISDYRSKSQFLSRLVA